MSKIVMTKMKFINSLDPECFTKKASWTDGFTGKFHKHLRKRVSIPLKLFPKIEGRTIFNLFFECRITLIANPNKA